MAIDVDQVLDAEPLQHEVPWMQRETLLHRLNGDPNPVHAEPDVPQAAGFDRPTLHGPVLDGLDTKAVVDDPSGGGVSKGQALLPGWDAAPVPTRPIVEVLP